jgi:hypothetical protein
VGAVDDVCGDAAACEAAVVDAVEVVVAEVAVELSAECAVARVEVASERGSPALVEDRFVHGFDGLKRELERYLHYYNNDRAHTGRLTQGRIPADIVYGARKMEPR